MPFRPSSGGIQAEYCCVKHAALGREQNKRADILEEFERSRQL